MKLAFCCFVLGLDEKGKFDEVVEEKGVKIVVEPKALMHVIGTKMDFVDDKLRYICCSMFIFRVFVYIFVLQMASSVVLFRVSSSCVAQVLIDMYIV